MHILSTATFEKAGDCDFKNDLYRFQDNEVKAELRSKLIEQSAKALMQFGEEYHPWTFTNFTEAIENAPETQRLIMFVTVAAAVDLGLKNDYCNHLALTSIFKLVDEYWFECAKQKAQYDLES